MGDLFDESLIYDPSKWQSWTTTSGEVLRPSSYTYHPDTSSFTVDIPSMYPHHMIDPEVWRKLEMEEPKMSVHEERDHRSLGRRYAVACSHEPDLSQDRILKSLSAMKAKLMMQCAPIKVENIECRMTPAVKNNIIMAYKRLEMYGKKTPFVARFDEYGRRLTDEVKIEVMKGMTIKILDPVDYGPYHIEFEGIVYDERLYKPSWDYGYTVDAGDVPF